MAKHSAAVPTTSAALPRGHRSRAAPSAGSAALDMISNGLVLLNKIDEDGGKAKADWMKYANDTATGIKGLIEAAKG